MVLVISILTSCSQKQDPVTIENNNDCDFVQNDENMDGVIDDAESRIMKECRENSLRSKSDIEWNLIGEWELTGNGNPWFPTISKPCGRIKITKEEMIFEFSNEQYDIRSTQQWEIEELNLYGKESFRLTLHPEYYFIINQFCENYMYVDDTAGDGVMFLYTKVK